MGCKQLVNQRLPWDCTNVSISSSYCVFLMTLNERIIIFWRLWFLVKRTLPDTNYVQTKGFNSFTVKRKKTTINIYDLGGHPSIQELWDHYYADVLLQFCTNISGKNWIQFQLQFCLFLNRHMASFLLWTRATVTQYLKLVIYSPKCWVITGSEESLFYC